MSKSNRRPVPCPVGDCNSGTITWRTTEEGRIYNEYAQKWEPTINVITHTRRCGRCGGTGNVWSS